MAINFIPNDPKTVNKLPMRKITPRADRRANRARFDVANAVAEGEYDVGTAEFLYWQVREAALAAVEAWEEIHGPFSSWQDDDSLEVFPDEGEDLNAYYDRPRAGRPERISFFHQKVGTKTYFSGASTDVVAHEAGHALLDALRPDFWTSFRFEVNSFHEAFGDCMAIITALHDKDSRKEILSSVAMTNPVESTAEELAEAIKKAIPGHNAGVPRQARNDFQWGPQGSLPEDGGPGELIYEVHSFGQVFTGCFYDTIVNIFNGMSSQSEANLLKATQTAGKLLVKAVQQAPQRAQYFREVGRLMILIDEQENSAANRSAVRDAFERHNIALGSSVTLAPQAAVGAVPAIAKAARRGAKAAPRGAKARGVAKAATLTPTAKRQLLSMIGAEKGKLEVAPVTIAGVPLQEAVHQRQVSLDDVDKRLKGVVAEAPQVSLLGQTHRTLAIMGHVSNADATDRDVESFVKSLVTHGQISYKPVTTAARRGARSLVAGTREAAPAGVTHEVREIRGQKTLVRIRFACQGAR